VLGHREVDGTGKTVAGEAELQAATLRRTARGSAGSWKGTEVQGVWGEAKKQS